MGPPAGLLLMKVLTTLSDTSAAQVAGFVLFLTSKYAISELLADKAMAGMLRSVAAYL